MIAIMIDQKLAHFEPSIKYTCDFIFNSLGVPYRYTDTIDYEQGIEIVILYTLVNPSKEELVSISNGVPVILIKAEADLLHPNKISKDFIKKNICEINLFDTFPVITTRPFDDPIEIHKIGDSYWVEIKYDIIANIFYHLSGYDDILFGQHNDFGVYTDNNLTYLSYTRIPYVNYQLWMVEQLLKEIVTDNHQLIFVKKETWPSGEDFASSITYDANRLAKWTVPKIFKSALPDLLLLMSFNFPLLFKNIKEKLYYLATNKEFYWRFDDIGEINSSHKIKATWFIAARSSNEDHITIDYTFDEINLNEALRRICDRKDEVSLLVDGATSLKSKEVENQKTRLSNVITGRVKGARNLAGKKVSDEEHFEKLDFLYDSSQRLIDQVGFRHGVAFPYRPYQTDYHKMSGYWEVPVVFSDDYLRTKKQLFLSKDNARSLVESLVKTVKNANGHITFRFSLPGFNDIPYLKDLIEYTISLLKGKNCYIETVGEIVSWLEKREQVKITKYGDDFKLFSPENIDRLTLSFHGDRKLVKVTGADFFKKGNRITLKGIKKNKEIIVHTAFEAQKELFPIAEDD